MQLLTLKRLHPACALELLLCAQIVFVVIAERFNWYVCFFIMIIVARPLGLHYDHNESPSVRQIVKMLITLEPHGIF